MISGTSIGKRHTETSFETFVVSPGNTKAMEACKRVASGESGGVILCGPVGTGKTHLLVSTARAFDKRLAYMPPKGDGSGEMVKVPPLAELMAGDHEGEDDGIAPYLRTAEIARHAYIEYWMILDLARTMRADVMDGDWRLTERCMKCHLLILDDAGREKLTDFVAQEIERIIDFRYRQMLPVAIATNLTPGELLGVYGEHMFSRLAQSCEIVEVLGKDYRKAAQVKCSTKPEGE